MSKETNMVTVDEYVVGKFFMRRFKLNLSFLNVLMCFSNHVKAMITSLGEERERELLSHATVFYLA